MWWAVRIRGRRWHGQLVNAVCGPRVIGARLNGHPSCLREETSGGKGRGHGSLWSDRV